MLEYYTMATTTDIIIYQAEDGRPGLEVRLRQDTVWLTLNQITELFQRDKSVISRHLRNIFRAGELNRSSVVAKNATTAADGKTYQVEYFNLDAIISVGYRVNSIRGTQFRIWATNVLRQHLVEGYTLNQNRLRETQEKLRELQGAVDLLERIVNTPSLLPGEIGDLVRIIRDYSYGLDLIDAYDYQRLTITGVSEQTACPLEYREALAAIEQLRAEYQAGDLFGREKDDSFQGSLKSIFQTFDGRELYPSIEEKAAHLLYFLVRNHPFIDGNKRIAAFMFLWFLDKNRYLYRTNGDRRLADNTLVALILMVAESKPQEKDMIVKMVVNLINTRNG